MARGFVRPPTLVEVVVDHIREAIFRGEFAPGQALREPELTELLDVSRSTVREAQRILAEEGLVEVVPHKGARVIRLSPRLVREVYSLRVLLEPYAVRLAIGEGGYSERDLENLESLLAQMIEADEVEDLYALVRADAKFHLAICEPSGHFLLLDFLSGLQARVRLCITTMAVRRLDLMPQEGQHRPVLDAIREGDAALAGDIISEHLGQAASMLLSSMEPEVTVGG
jgi:DNA-binding GntR family transcriptional regulator